MNLNSISYRVPFIGPRLRVARERLKQRLDERDQVIDNLIRVLAEGQALVHSVPKSGVTWCLLLIANYWAKSLGRTAAVTFEGLNSEFIRHSIEKSARNRSFSGWLENRQPFLANAFSIGIVVHTHKPIRSVEFRRSLFLVRNPYDFVVSYHHYFGKARGNNVCLAERIDWYIQRYVSLVRYQKEIYEARADDTMILPYERLKGDTAGSLKEILRHLGVQSIDDDLIDEAVRDSSIRKQREFEKEGGAIVSPSLEGSFIRSGVPGQWREVLTETQVGMIDARLPSDIRRYLEEVGVT